jgi:hypothetical protein
MSTGYSCVSDFLGNGGKGDRGSDEIAVEWKNKVQHERITIERARRAVACGAAGCTRGDNLLLTRIRDFGERVLCPTHALDLIERELDNDEEAP